MSTSLDIFEDAVNQAGTPADEAEEQEQEEEVEQEQEG